MNWNASALFHNRHGGLRADDGRPFADAPGRDQTVQHVRIGFREFFGDGRTVPLEQQHGPVDGIGKSTPQDEVSPRDGLSAVGQMRGPQRRSPHRVIGDDV